MLSLQHYFLGFFPYFLIFFFISLFVFKLLCVFLFMQLFFHYLFIYLFFFPFGKKSFTMKKFLQISQCDDCKQHVLKTKTKKTSFLSSRNGIFFFLLLIIHLKNLLSFVSLIFFVNFMYNQRNIELYSFFFHHHCSLFCENFKLFLVVVNLKKGPPYKFNFPSTEMRNQFYEKNNFFIAKIWLWIDMKIVAMVFWYGPKKVCMIIDDDDDDDGESKQ